MHKVEVSWILSNKILLLAIVDAMAMNFFSRESYDVITAPCKPEKLLATRFKCGDKLLQS